MLVTPLLYLRALATGELPLRSIGDLYTPAPRREQAIPNVVYQTWVQQRLGRRHANALRAFRMMNADYAFEFFDTPQMDAYMRTAYDGQPIRDVYDHVTEGPARVDIWRYCILLERGGVYMDINKRVRAPLRDFIGRDTAALLSLEANPYAGPMSPGVLATLGARNLVINWGLAFAPGHGILRRTIDNIVQDYPRHKGVVQRRLKHAIVHFTGPHMLTRSVAEEIDQNGAPGLRVAGVEFHGHGESRTRGSWVRYIVQPSYRKRRDVVMVR